MDRDKLKKLLRCVGFFLVFTVLLFVVQNRLTPEWDWPNDGSRSSTAMSGIYFEPENSLEVLWVGTSHLHNAVSPMEIYKRSGIHSYNLATTGQPFLASYYRLKSTLERQNPQVVVLDASSCFRSNFWQKSETAWRKMIDSVPWYNFKDKFVLTRGMVSLNSNSMGMGELVSGVMPIIRYHSNYMLDRLDYLDRHRDMVYFLKGQAVITSTEAVPDNRQAAEEGEGDSSKKLLKILEEQTPTLERFVALCREHNCKLVLTKIPVNTTANYEGYWDQQKHDMIQALADRLELPFLDLNYEDVGIDWKTDTCDGGEHVNELGALKVSDFYADWLMEHYKLELSKDAALKDSWDLQLQVFEYEHDRYRMEMEYNLASYLKHLSKGNYTVLAAVGGNIGDYWTREMQADFKAATGAAFDMVEQHNGVPDQAAYLCVSDHGKVLKEKSQKAECSAKGKLADGTSYSVSSHDMTSDGKRSIVVNGTEYASEGKGIAFVVYDNDLHCVVDSVCFNTTEEAIRCKRVDSQFLHPMREKMLDYEYEILKVL